MAEEKWQPDQVYLYRSADGITRLRCGRHVHRGGRGKPQRIWNVWPVGRLTCPECAYEERDQAFLVAPEETEQ